MIEPNSQAHVSEHPDKNYKQQLSFRDTVEVLNQSLPNGTDELVLLESLLSGTYGTDQAEEIAGLDRVVALENGDNRHWITPLHAVRRALLQERVVAMREDISRINDYIDHRPGVLFASYYSREGVEQYGQLQALRSEERDKTENTVTAIIEGASIQRANIIRLKLDVHALLPDEYHAYEKYIADCET